ncbi:hypothetical protein [Rhodoligotrophos ferricapiens]|uniref:hypothetical protein n=1 Tax=Rhodoligotrophos ferricapiens TaxID=3069264 RepID=UPI00315DE465
MTRANDFLALDFALRDGEHRSPDTQRGFARREIGLIAGAGGRTNADVSRVRPMGRALNAEFA